MTRRALAAAVLAAVAFVAGCAGAVPSPVPSQSSTPPQSQSQPQTQTQPLLPAASAYVEAVARRDVDVLAAAFAEDGVVVDVRRRIEGRAAIREWAAREVIGGSLRVDGITPLGPQAQRVRVHWAPSGSGGWAADYTFTVVGDAIAEADLQYAR
jgi:hypothetical protein